jgi:hypothetical protein
VTLLFFLGDSISWLGILMIVDPHFTMMLMHIGLVDMWWVILVLGSLSVVAFDA